MLTEMSVNKDLVYCELTISVGQSTKKSFRFPSDTPLRKYWLVSFDKISSISTVVHTANAPSLNYILS